MNYIYDVIVNFDIIPYEFYEWNKTDTITHLKKIPIIKVKSEIIYDLIYKKIKVNEKLLNIIKNKTEFYTKADSNFIAIFTDTYLNICIKFNKDGINTYKSFLQIDEDEEVLDLSRRIEETSFDYQIFSVNYIPNFKTRKEIEVDNYVLNNIKKLYNNNEDSKLKYIYYDCFGKKEEDKNKIYSELNSQVMNNNIVISNKIYDFFRLISSKSN